MFMLCINLPMYRGLTCVILFLIYMCTKLPEGGGGSIASSRSIWISYPSDSDNRD